MGRRKRRQATPTNAVCAVSPEASPEFIAPSPGGPVAEAVRLAILFEQRPKEPYVIQDTPRDDEVNEVVEVNSQDAATQDSAGSVCRATQDSGDPPQACDVLDAAAPAAISERSPSPDCAVVEREVEPAQANCTDRSPSLDQTEVAAAMSTGEAGRSPSHHDRSAARGPSFALSTKRSARSLSEGHTSRHKRDPHFMAPLNRVVPMNLISKPKEDYVVPPVPERIFKPPSTSEIECRELVSRDRIQSIESRQWADMRETFSYRLADLRSSIANRETYLKSEDYARYAAAGKQRRAALEERVSQRAASEVGTCTFAPQLSKHAGQLPSRSREEFIRSSQQWVEAVQKKRRAASAAVFREQDVTFAPKLSVFSEKLVSKLQRESRHLSIVEGWERRMQEHKEKMDQLQQKYAPTFHPQTEAARRSSQRHSADRSASPPRQAQQVPLRQIVSRLYDAGLEHKKALEAKIEASRRDASPPPLRRSSTAIQEHVKSMQEHSEKAKRKLEIERDKAAKSTKQENSHRPSLNPASVSLAELHRQRKIQHASAQQEESHKLRHGGIFELLYKTPTTSMERKQQVRSLSREGPQQHPAEAQRRSPQNTHHSASSSRASMDFMLRNEKLLKERSMHAREWRTVIDEEETRECTFAPAISSTSARLAQERRHTRWDRTEKHVDPVDAGSAQAWRLREPLREHGGESRPAFVVSHSTRLGHFPASSASPPILRSSASPNTASAPAGREQRTSYFHRTDAEATRAQSSMRRGVSQGSEQSIQDRLDDIEGLLKEWKWLEQSSRV